MKLVLYNLLRSNLFTSFSVNAKSPLDQQVTMEQTDFSIYNHQQKAYSVQDKRLKEKAAG